MSDDLYRKRDDLGLARRPKPWTDGLDEIPLNYNFVWLYFDKFYWGLLLGIELAAISDPGRLGIGLSLALLHVDGPRWVRRIRHRLCRVDRNQPLLLLVYLVFYGVPSSAVSNTTMSHHSSSPCPVYSGAYLVKSSAPDSRLCRGSEDAGKAIGLTPGSACFTSGCRPCFGSSCPRSAEQSVRIVVQGHLGRRGACRPELTYAAKWLSTNKFRIIEAYSVAAPMYLVTGYVIFAALRLLKRKFR